MGQSSKWPKSHIHKRVYRELHGSKGDVPQNKHNFGPRGRIWSMLVSKGTHEGSQNRWQKNKASRASGQKVVYTNVCVGGCMAVQGDVPKNRYNFGPRGRIRSMFVGKGTHETTRICFIVSEVDVKMQYQRPRTFYSNL